MNVPITIEDDTIESCVDSGLGAIRYWANVAPQSARRSSVRVREAYAGGDSARGPGPWVLLTPNRIRLGVVRMGQRRPRVFARLLNGTADADVGDLLIQLAILGEERYV